MYEACPTIFLPTKTSSMLMNVYNVHVYVHVHVNLLGTMYIIYTCAYNTNGIKWVCICMCNTCTNGCVCVYCNSNVCVCVTNKHNKQTSSHNGL